MYETNPIRKKKKKRNYYSSRPGFRPGSLDKNPKMNKETKNVTTVYTKIFNVNINFIFGKLFIGYL